MRRYVSGLMTGALMGAVVAGVWLLKRPRQSVYRLAWKSMRGAGPQAWEIIRRGSRLARATKRKIS